jgi:uncharacterized protein (TIGR02285 family)
MVSRLRLLALLVAVLAARAAPAETVTWMLGELPPLVVTEGTLAGQGAGQIGFRMLSERLGQFSWRIEHASALRILYEIERRDGICSFGFAKLPEREGKMVFGIRPMVVPGFGVILREDRLPEFQRVLDRNGAVDLSLLGQAEGMTGGYVRARPHFDGVKRFIEAHPSSLVADDAVKLFRQLQARHIDFLFGLRDETNYFAALLGQRDRFAALPIAGTDQFGLAYMVCSNGPLGRKAMAALDDYLADDRHWAEFMAPWQQWLAPGDYTAALKSQTNPVR